MISFSQDTEKDVTHLKKCHFAKRGGGAQGTSAVVGCGAWKSVCAKTGSVVFCLSSHHEMTHPCKMDHQVQSHLCWSNETVSFILVKFDFKFQLIFVQQFQMTEWLSDFHHWCLDWELCLHSTHLQPISSCEEWGFISSSACSSDNCPWLQMLAE